MSIDYVSNKWCEREFTLILEGIQLDWNYLNELERSNCESRTQGTHNIFTTIIYTRVLYETVKPHALPSVIIKPRFISYLKYYRSDSNSTIPNLSAMVEPVFSVPMHLHSNVMAKLG